ncbi:unnamed protein product [Heligmosomoides polygyrus]|uniref:NodB homology domain-containing protein n=1 Tax=Heligmosomoides polygyrus TaxID=6339 RepID=A0A183GWM0_HELPZ|nr:unnamed protein product [Heligmosomoides polygyrus]
MFYVTSTQAENEFIDLHERAGHRIEHLGTHKEKRFRESTGCDCPKVSRPRSSFAALTHELKIGRSTVPYAVYESCRSIVEGYWSEAFPIPIVATWHTWHRSVDVFRSLWKYSRGVGSTMGNI